VRLVPPAGDALDGALRVARTLASTANLLVLEGFSQ
jgi:hypothetical protein